jgi:hypothetical protein
MSNINSYLKHSGRFINESGEDINIADLIDALNDKDFATDTKIDELIANLGDITESAETDPAQNASNIAALKGLLTLIGEKQETPTSYTELGRLKSLEDKIDAIIEWIDGTDTTSAPNFTQYGSNMALSQTPKAGTKTVTSIAAEIFADTGRLSGRSMLYVRNNHESIAIRIGASDITDIKGRRILPQSEEKIEFDPQSDIALYAISEFGNVEVEVFEA